MKLATTMNDQEAMYFEHSLVKFKCGLLSPHFPKGDSCGFCDEFLHVTWHSLRNWLYWGKSKLTRLCLSPVLLHLTKFRCSLSPRRMGWRIPLELGLLSRQPRMRSLHHLWQLCSSNHDPRFIDAETDQRNLIICPSHTPVPAPKFKTSLLFFTQRKKILWSNKEGKISAVCSLGFTLHLWEVRCCSVRTQTTPRCFDPTLTPTWLPCCFGSCKGCCNPSPLMIVKKA